MKAPTLSATFCYFWNRFEQMYLEASIPIIHSIRLNKKFAFETTTLITYISLVRSVRGLSFYWV